MHATPAHPRGLCPATWEQQPTHLSICPPTRPPARLLAHPPTCQPCGVDQLGCPIQEASHLRVAAARLRHLLKHLQGEGAGKQTGGWTEQQ